jgi:hypothetical protein
MDPEKVRAVLDMPKPTDVSGVLRIVGFVTHSVGYPEILLLQGLSLTHHFEV